MGFKLRLRISDNLFARDDAQQVQFVRQGGKVVAAWFSGWRFERVESPSPGKSRQAVAQRGVPERMSWDSGDFYAK